MRLPRALNLLRSSPHYRRYAFSVGLQKNGFKVVDAIQRPEPGDVLISWNRYGGAGEVADHFERNGATVLVAENCPFGNEWLGDSWYSIARRHVALGGGEIPDGGPARWDSFGAELAPWREGGSETVILGQRGIGHSDIKSPDMWAEQVQRRIGGRIRRHPGPHAAVPLAKDLKEGRCVVTWASAAAVQALALGVPAFYAHDGFAMASASLPLSAWGSEPKRDDSVRLSAFRRLAWAMWRLSEIESGVAFEHLLASR